jgi:2,5-dioxopentanoate dehydrogenase
MPPGILLSEAGPRFLAEAVASLEAAGAERVTGGLRARGPGYRFENTLLRVAGDTFLERPYLLQAEAFGPVSLFVFAEDGDQLRAIAGRFEGNLTGSIYSHSGGEDDTLYNEVAPLLRAKVGRLLNDKMPTGVTVSPAMVHGGPFPATGHPGFTAVGIPASLNRFAALHGYDNVRPERLPPELQDENPTGTMWRLIDGVWTQRSL